MGTGSSRDSKNPESEEYFEIERILVENKQEWNDLSPDLQKRMNVLIETLKSKAEFDTRITSLIDNIKGEIEAQYQLGFLYSEGRGIEKDDEKAVFYLQEASRREHLEATHLLACLYYENRGVPKETEIPQYNQFRAVFLWNQCIEKGHADAERKLGDAYTSGIGVTKADPIKASQHYMNSTSKSAADAFHIIGDMYEKGLGGLEKDEKAAAKRYTLSANEGNSIAKYRLGSMYMEGRGVSKDKDKAMNLFESAVEQGNCHAQYHLAIICAQSDPFRAIGLLNHAAIQGHEMAKHQLQRIQQGLLIKDEELVPQSKWQWSYNKVKQNLRKMRSNNDIKLESMAAEAVLSNLDNPNAEILNNSISHRTSITSSVDTSSGGTNTAKSTDSGGVGKSTDKSTDGLSLSISMDHVKEDENMKDASGGGGVVMSPKSPGFLSGLMSTLSPKRILGGGSKSKVLPFDNGKGAAEGSGKPPKRSVMNSTTASSTAKTVKKSTINKKKSSITSVNQQQPKKNSFRSSISSPKNKSNRSIRYV